MRWPGVTRAGQTPLPWSLDDPARGTAAADLFARLSAEHKMPFARSANDPAHLAERVTAFDPTAEEIVWIRPVAGRLNGSRSVLAWPRITAIDELPDGSQVLTVAP